jgi:hypothetical protein
MPVLVSGAAVRGSAGLFLVGGWDSWNMNFIKHPTVYKIILKNVYIPYYNIYIFHNYPYNYISHV